MLEATKQRYDMFVQHFAANMFQNATQAAIKAKYKPSRAVDTGSRLCRNVYVKAQIAKAKADIAARTAEPVERVVADLRKQADGATSEGDRSTAIRALELIGRHVGAFEKDNTQQAGQTVANIFAIMQGRQHKRLVEPIDEDQDV